MERRKEEREGKTEKPKHWSEVFLDSQHSDDHLLAESSDTVDTSSQCSVEVTGVPSPVYPTLPLTRDKMTRHQIIDLYSTYSDSDKGR